MISDASPNDNTWDLTPPRRPGIGDVANGAGKTDDTDKGRPDPQTMPTAAEDNTKSKCIVGVGGVVPNVLVWVRFNAGAPIIDSIGQCGTKLLTSDFVPTDNGVGDTTITWAQSKVPAPIGNGPVAIPQGATAVEMVTENLAPGGGNASCRVRSLNNAGAATDAPFLLQIY